MVLNTKTLETYKMIRALLKTDLEFVNDRIEYLEELEAQMESDAKAMEDMIREGTKLGIYKESDNEKQ